MSANLINNVLLIKNINSIILSFSTFKEQSAVRRVCKKLTTVRASRENIIINKRGSPFFERMLRIINYNIPKQIRKIDLSCGIFINNDLYYLRCLENLKSINISNNEYITDNGLIHIQHLHNIEEINISNCVRITKKGILYLNTLEKLKYIIINNCKLLL